MGFNKRIIICTYQKIVLRKWKSEPEWRKYLLYMSDKGLLFRIYKELLQINNEKYEQTNWKTGKWLQQTFYRRKCKLIKRCLTTLIILEMQIKPALRCQFTPTRMANVKKSDDTKCRWRDEATGTLISHVFSGSVKWYNHFGLWYDKCSPLISSILPILPAPTSGNHPFVLGIYESTYVSLFVCLFCCQTPYISEVIGICLALTYFT